MEPTQPESDKTQSQQKPSLLWRILRSIPLTILLLMIGILLILFLMGGVPRIMAWYMLQLLLPIPGLIFLLAIIIYVIVKRRYSRLLIVTSLIALLSLLPAIMLIKPIPYPTSLEATKPSATVRLPADGPLKVAWGGDKMETNYHVFAPDQRWAYDLIVEPYNNGSDKLEDYGCYGIPVVAPTSGLVTIAHDGEPDAVPGIFSNNTEASEGNHVVIR